LRLLKGAVVPDQTAAADAFVVWATGMANTNAIRNPDANLSNHCFAAGDSSTISHLQIAVSG
jgi:hypothetical protein